MFCDYIYEIKRSECFKDVTTTHCQTFLQNTNTFFYQILNTLKFECASASNDITKEHQDDENTKQKSKSIGITNSFNTYNDSTFLPLQNSIDIQLTDRI